MTQIDGSSAQRSIEELEQIAIGAAQFLHDQRAERIMVLNVRDMIQISSYFVLASGRSPRQVRTLGDGVERFLKPNHLPRLGAHGRDDCRWYCLDHGEIVLHLFDAESREYYDLENLWAGAPRIEFDLKTSAVTMEADDSV